MCICAMRVCECRCSCEGVYVQMCNEGVYVKVRVWYEGD